MSDTFRAAFIRLSSELGVVDWRGVIARGLFLNACKFATQELLQYPSNSRAKFRDALGECAAGLAARATWFDLNPSRPPDASTSDEGRILNEALSERIVGITLDGLRHLDFREACNALALAWRERIDLHAVLAVNLLDILPAQAKWPRKDGEIAALRFVLNIARSELIPRNTAHRLLTAVSPFLVTDVCANMQTLPLFLLVWSTAALHYERVSRHSFEGILPDDQAKVLLEVLQDRAKKKASEDERLAQFALAGLLAILAPRLAGRVRSSMAPAKSETRKLLQLALEQTFVPAYFALEGIGFVQGNMFSPLVCMGLLLKAKDYEDVGPAVDRLCARLRKHGGTRQRT